MCIRDRYIGNWHSNAEIRKFERHTSTRRMTGGGDDVTLSQFSTFLRLLKAGDCFTNYGNMLMHFASHANYKGGVSETASQM